jgi:hypothetical protein
MPIGGQHRFAAGDGGHAAEPKQDQRDELRFGLADAMTDLREEPGRESRQQEQDHGGRRAEESQPQIVMREHDAERQHRAEVVDEAGGEDDLAHLAAIEAGLHHHRVDDGDGGRRQRNPCDLRLVPRPMDHIMGVGEHAEIGGEKADDADR